MAETELNIYQKLAKIRKQVEVVQKNKSGFNYRYVSDDELLAKITGQMEKLELSLIPQITPQTMQVSPFTYTKYNKSKKADEAVTEILTNADMVYTWINNANPEERIEVPWVTVGQQADASQSFGSGLTYSYRYFLLKYFGAATPEDDPDHWRTKQREADAAGERMVAEQIIGEFDKAIKAYLAANEDKADDVKAFVSKYAKKGNYFAITDPKVATTLLEEFNNTYGQKGAK